MRQFPISAFAGTIPTGELITSGLPVARPEHGSVSMCSPLGDSWRRRFAMHLRLMAACCVLMWPQAVTAQTETSGAASKPAVTPPTITPSSTQPRARDLGVPFDGTPGPLNAITDVAGVEVGYKTLISGEGRLVVGKGPVRTGVTAVLPRGKQGTKSTFAGYFAGNGNGDMTGTHWIEESGLLETPILITNTGSVGVVRDAAVAWMVEHKHPGPFWYPVAAETADSTLNDIKGQHVTAKDTQDALISATSGPLSEGNVGGGTGMICNGFKGGTGTASRLLDAAQGGYTVGVLVQCNYGRREQLRVAGIAVAREMNLQKPCVAKLLKPPVQDHDGNPAPLCDSRLTTTTQDARKQ